MVFPKTSDAELNLRCQNAALISATGTRPIWSSSDVKDRPRRGCTPSTRKKSPETNSPVTCSASPRPVRLNPELRATAIDEKVWLSFLQSRKLGKEMDPRSKFG